MRELDYKNPITIEKEDGEDHMYHHQHGVTCIGPSRYEMHFNNISRRWPLFKSGIRFPWQRQAYKNYIYFRNKSNEKLRSRRQKKKHKT